ncbi:MAG: AbrB/MazE/SpoVT family DNA-binding domain-containing protein [bacterium]|nr:AbrB/MazE/SpoVT family DNA-binding domain-containing protein [bacterium]
MAKKTVPGPEGGDQIVFGVVKVNNKGQVIIPVDLRNELGIKEGDQLVAAKTKDGDGVLLLKMKALNEMFLSSRAYETD